MKIVTAAEMTKIDRRTSEQFSVPSLKLMENAGTAVAEFCLREHPDAKTIGVICGKGNNGGDGFVAARKLHEAGRKIQILLLGEPAEVKGDASQMLSRLPTKPLAVHSEEELNGTAAHQVYGCDLLVDAILGTGFRPPLNALYRSAIERFWDAECAAPVVSVDLPSGTLADEQNDEYTNATDGQGYRANPTARSDAVITFTAPKLAHIFQDLTHGPILVAGIGTPSEAIESESGLHAIVGNTAEFTLHQRRPDSNKGDFGHVLVVGGSRGKAGAAAMAGIAALKAGAGLCTVVTPSGVQSLVSGFMAELMTEGLAETEAGTLSAHAAADVQRLSAHKSVIAIGPGISRQPETSELVSSIVTGANVPVVLDADGLNAFEAKAELLDGSHHLLVLTPHPGEMARLTGCSIAAVQADRIGTARRFAQRRQCILVLKGWRTLVAEPNGRVWVNMTGNPGMATGGTGDVLTGMIAGMIAQFWPKHGDIFPVLAGVYLHGLAGDLACRELGPNAMTAMDVVRHISAAYQNVFWNPGLALLKAASPDPWWYRQRNRIV